MPVEHATHTSQYLTFTLDDEPFGLEISRVREVLELSTLTRIPRTPSFLRGVINVRGNVVPVVDLRRKLGMSAKEEVAAPCVIIAEIEIEGATTVLGALADSVQEVLELETDRIESPPRLGMRLNTAFLKGIGKRDERFLLLVDIDRVFSREDLADLGVVDPEDEPPPARGDARRGSDATE